MPQKQIAVGWLVSGPSIPAGTTITAFDTATGVITFSRATTTALGASTPVTFTIRSDTFSVLEMDYIGTQAAMAEASTRARGATVAMVDPDISLG